MDLMKLGEGRVAEIFRWTPDTILKLYREPDHGIRARAEAEVTQRVRAIGAPAPRCSGVVEVEGRHGLVLQWLPGPVMGAAFLTDDVDVIGRGLGELHAVLHAKSGSGFPELAERMLVRARNSVPRDLWPSVRAAFDGLPSARQLIHGDIHPYNVVWDGYRWLVIDWDGAYAGHPAAGVARTLFLLTEAAFLEPIPSDSIRREAADAYLRGYRSLAPMPDELLNLWRVPVLAARLSEGIEEERRHLIDILRHSV